MAVLHKHCHRFRSRLRAQPPGKLPDSTLAPAPRSRTGLAGRDRVQRAIRPDTYNECTIHEKRKHMKTLRHQRPSGITILAFFEFLGTITCIGLLFFTHPGSRDFIALSIAAALGFVGVLGLWTLQFLAFWFTAVYE